MVFSFLIEKLCFLLVPRDVTIVFARSLMLMQDAASCRPSILLEGRSEPTDPRPCSADNDKTRTRCCNTHAPVQLTGLMLKTCSERNQSFGLGEV